MRGVSILINEEASAKNLLTFLVVFLAIAPMSTFADLKAIDRGKGTWDKNTGYWLLFVARDYMPGHAFIVWGKVNRKGKKWASLYGYGKYPTNSKKAAFGTVLGHIARESTASLKSANTGLAVAVSKQMYDYVLTNTEPIRTGSGVPYDLVDKSCVDFVELAARAIGLNTPSTTGLSNHPQRFIEKLKSLNN